MKIGVIADDFTGASDIALTLAEAGFQVTQFVGTPAISADPWLDAAVIALKSRTAPVDQAVQESLQACDWLLNQGASQIVLKVCSTFDSTSEGNIGPVLDALSERLGTNRSIVCPAFPENGRSVYQGHLFVNDVLLNESGMQDHPLTPMRDADLRRVLAEQSQHDVHHLPITTIMRGAADIQAALPDRGHVIADAIRDVDLIEIGRAAAEENLLCGGSGIALGLPANFGAVAQTPEWSPLVGPGVVLSGSCSRATRVQVALFKTKSPYREVSAGEVLAGTVTVTTLVDWVLSQPVPPLIYSSAEPEVVQAAQAEFGRETVASAIEAFFAELAYELMGQGVRRFVVAGGETSGAIVGGLNADALKIGPRLAAGVPVVTFMRDQSIALALKSGNFGDEDFFARALAFMEGDT